MTQIIAGADVGGSKSAAAVWKDGTEVARVSGVGAAVRPGRALSSAATIATLVRSALTSAGLLRADLLVVGAAGAGREPEAGDLARALRNEDMAARVHVTTDLALLLEGAFPEGPGLVLAAGTGSVRTMYASRRLKWRRSGLNSEVAVPVQTITVFARTTPPSNAISTCLAPARTLVARDRSKNVAPRDFAAAASPRHAR